MEISEQLVLVTGGARGLGKYIVQAAAQEGASVVINYHESEQAAQALAKTLGDSALAVKADVTDKEQVEAMFEASQRHFGRSID
ncbi:MAG: SDR family NAD(P)-dependent oxidoreductase, partial [Orrella sp.]